MVGCGALFLRLAFGAGGLGSGGWVDERKGRAVAPPVAGAEDGRLLSGRCRGAGLRRGARIEVSVRMEPEDECSVSAAELLLESDSFHRVLRGSLASSGALRAFARRAFFCLGGKGTAGSGPAGRGSSARSARSLSVPCNATMFESPNALWCARAGGETADSCSNLLS